MKRYVIWAAIALALIAMAASSVAADQVIRTYGVAPFVYGGYSYIPLKSTSSYLGAALLWDSLKNRATITYSGHELGLVVGSTTAYYGGRPVVLPAAPVLVGGQMFVPTVAFSRYLDVPVRWDDEDDEVYIQGAPGWGYYHVERGGPPPWAPAHGRRRQGYVAYAPMPFIYSGITYLPLRSATDFIGAALLWDSLRNRAVITYNGRDIGLVIGSPTVYYGPQVVVLPAAPIVVRNVIYVPQDLFVRHMSIPVERSGGVLKLKGPKGWHEMRLASAPPARYMVGRGRGKGQSTRPSGRGQKAGRAAASSSGKKGRAEVSHGQGRGQKAKGGEGKGGGKGGEHGKGGGGGKGRH